jgi:hypothetical protein
MLVSGMIIGSVFTLFFVPAIYMFVAKTRTRAVDHLLDENGEARVTAAN